MVLRAFLLAAVSSLLLSLGCDDDSVQAAPTSERDTSLLPGPSSDVREIAEACTGLTADQVRSAVASGVQPENAAALGAAPPSFVLPDVQPLSCAYGESYGIEGFAGRVTLVTLLSAGCGYCQSQASKLEQMRIELEDAGFDVHMVAINVGAQPDLIHLLTQRATFPMFQDTEASLAWELFDGRKDDIYIYDASHRLTAFFRSGEGDSLNLSSEEGWSNVRTALYTAGGSE